MTRLSDSELPQTLEEERLNGRRIGGNPFKPEKKTRPIKDRSQRPCASDQAVFGFRNKIEPQDSS
jgi:hypothetical protein